MLVTTALAQEHTPYFFSVESSTLGLRPGEWPVELKTELGNKLNFIRRSKKLDADGDLQWVTYLQANGCIILRVWND